MAVKNENIITTESLAKGKNINEIEIKDNGADDIVEKLKKQPKLPIIIPIDPLGNNEPLLVSVNGSIWAIPKGKLVQVPKTIFDIVQESMVKTMKTKEMINVEKKEA